MSIERLIIRWKRNGLPGCRTRPANGHSSRPDWHEDQRQRPVLITGGAGFIGTNLAHRLLSANQPVILYDNLSRPGVEQNLAWLRYNHGDLVSLERADIRDFASLRKAVSRASRVFHFAAQVAVTPRLDAPIEDFEINARGTLNLLEALRSLEQPPPLLFTSTHKVYGDLGDVRLRMSKGRHEPENGQVRAHGFGEDRPLACHSPYGCSKGSACQYVLDYARTFGLRAAVFRMSCIYGLHQCGNEDQGWVAHFLMQALENSPITIYGDGRQVCDVLFVEDLVEALLLAQQHIDEIRGQVFNMGGGPANTVSPLELLDLIGQLHGHAPEVRYADWRPADQQYYVSDTRKFTAATGWSARVAVRVGVAKLFHWLRECGRIPLAKVLSLSDAAPDGNGPAQRPLSRAMQPKTARGRKTIQLSHYRPRPAQASKRGERKLARTLSTAL